MQVARGKWASGKWQVGKWASGKWQVGRWWVGLTVVGLLLIAVTSGCGTVTSSQAAGPITASGFIEGDEVTIAPEVGGRIAEMAVDRGDTVEEGQVLVRLDDTTLRSQRAEAEAGLAAAQANLARVLAGARPQEIAAAEAALAQARTQRDGAHQAMLDARETISNPLSLNAQIDEARSQVRLAEQKVEMAKADLAATELKRNVYAEQGGDVERTWDLQVQAAQAALTQAQAELQGAQDYLNALLAMRANPISLEAQLHQAESQYHVAEAQVAAAQAALDDLRAGPTDEEVAVAEAQVHQAEAAIRLIDAQIAQLTLTAPLDGLVTARSARAGETASPGMPLLTIANLDEVTLVIYVPENRIGEVHVGQAVDVTVDSFPDRVFRGEVVYIAGEAEFTPRNVQTQEERVNLVFAVKVRLPNPDHALKPGLPADATLR